MNLLHKLKSDIKSFLKETGMSKSALGAEALGDHHAAILILEDRKDPRLSTVQKLYDFMGEK